MFRKFEDYVNKNCKINAVYDIHVYLMKVRIMAVLNLS